MPLALGVALAFNAAAMAGDLPKRSRSYCDALRIGITLSAAVPATCAAHASRFEDRRLAAIGGAVSYPGLLSGAREKSDTGLE
jgi:hypothetical protein